jgi:predicted RNA methylase
LEALVPSQTNRSDEQIEWQQFATPPRLAWLAARACATDASNELVLEPSAGTGMLAVWAAKAGARLAAQRNLTAAPRLPEACSPLPA